MMLTEETPVRVTRRRIDWARLLWLMKSSPLTMIGGVIIVLMLLLMVLSPWITPYDPNAIDLSARLLPPTAAHWLRAVLAHCSAACPASWAVALTPSSCG